MFMFCGSIAGKQIPPVVELSVLVWIVEQELGGQETRVPISMFPLLAAVWL